MYSLIIPREYFIHRRIPSEKIPEIPAKARRQVGLCCLSACLSFRFRYFLFHDFQNDQRNDMKVFREHIIHHGIAGQLDILNAIEYYNFKFEMDYYASSDYDI
jgi:hypothetical protein